MNELDSTVVQKLSATGPGDSGLHLYAMNILYTKSLVLLPLKTLCNSKLFYPDDLT